MSISITYVLNGKNNTLKIEATKKIKDLKDAIANSHLELKANEIELTFKNNHVSDDNKTIKDVIGSEKQPKFIVKSDKSSYSLISS